jgi:hypothetical protein
MVVLLLILLYAFVSGLSSLIHSNGAEAARMFILLESAKTTWNVS